MDRLRSAASLRTPHLTLSWRSLSPVGMETGDWKPFIPGKGARDKPGTVPGLSHARLTVDINDREGPEGETRPAAQLPSHQLDNLCNLIIALFQEVLAGA